MKNVIDQLDAKLVKDFKITEAFILDGELYTTSEYTLSFELIAEIESQLGL